MIFNILSRIYKRFSPCIIFIFIFLNLILLWINCISSSSPWPSLTNYMGSATLVLIFHFIRSPHFLHAHQPPSYPSVYDITPLLVRPFSPFPFISFATLTASVSSLLKTYPNHLNLFYRILSTPDILWYSLYTHFLLCLF